MPFCRLLLQWMVVLLPKLDVNKYLVTVCFLAFSLMPIVFDSLSDIIKSTSLTRYFTFSSENRALSLALPWPPSMRWVPVLSLWYCAPSPGSFLRTSSSWLSFQFSILTQHPLNILKVFLWIVLKRIFLLPHILLNHPFSSFLYIQTPSLNHTHPPALTWPVIIPLKTGSLSHVWLRSSQQGRWCPLSWVVPWNVPNFRDSSLHNVDNSLIEIHQRPWWADKRWWVLGFAPSPSLY